MTPDEASEALQAYGAINEREAILAALRAELARLSCFEPSRMIGSPCSCAAGLLRAIEIVEAAK